MQTILKPVPEETMFDESAPAFHAILLYDSAEQADTANSVFHRVCAKLGDSALPRLSAWSFDSLRDPEGQRLACLDAANADLVILSARGTTPLPPFVQGALQDWAAMAMPIRRGLVTLLSDVTEDRKAKSPVTQFVDEFSEQHGFDSFSRGLRNEWQHPRFQLYDEVETGLMDQEFMAVTAPGTRWGIND